MAEDSSGAKLASEIALWHLREQIAYGRALDTKIGSAFALSAAMIALLGSALIFAAPVEQGGVGTAVISAAGLFIANIVVSTTALLIGGQDIGPGVEDPEFAASAGNEELSQYLAEQLALAERRNNRVLRVKSMLVGAALLLTAATAISIAVAAILAV
ncbi:MAG: hypothetical protein OXS30_06945 [Chloroflexota bacterium]|nr:hypothetical protein [Chloroflexota bacterium]